MAMYGVAAKSLKKYDSKIKELFGEGAPAKVKTAIAQDTANETHVPNPIGDACMFYDMISGRYFKIGQGCGSGSKVNNGGCDSMNYHTGTSASSRTTAGPVQYRNIEGLWSNVFDWVDGINMNSRSVYICTTPGNFADNTTTNYTATGITLPSSNGYIKAMGYSSAAPWAMIPSANGGSETTYVPDCVYSRSGWCVLYVGGCYNSDANYGLLYFGASYDSSSSNVIIGARLLFIP